jgi:hypothetical protein
MMKANCMPSLEASETKKFETSTRWRSEWENRYLSGGGYVLGSFNCSSMPCGEPWKVSPLSFKVLVLLSHDKYVFVGCFLLPIFSDATAVVERGNLQVLFNVIQFNQRCLFLFNINSMTTSCAMTPIIPMHIYEIYTCINVRVFIFCSPRCKSTSMGR